MNLTRAAGTAAMVLAAAGCASTSTAVAAHHPQPIPVTSASHELTATCQPDGAGGAYVTMHNPNAVPVRVATLTITPTDDAGNPLPAVTVHVNVVIPAHGDAQTPYLGAPLEVPNTCTVTGDS